MKRLQFIPRLVLLALLSSCSRSSPPPASSSKDFTTTNGSTVRLGAVVIDDTNVPLTNVQVK